MRARPPARSKRAPATKCAYGRLPDRVRTGATRQARRGRRSSPTATCGSPRSPSSSAVTNQLANVLLELGVGPGVEDRVVRPELDRARQPDQRGAQARRHRGAAELPARRRGGGLRHRPLRRRRSSTSTPSSPRCSSASAQQMPEGRPHPRVRRRGAGGHDGMIDPLIAAAASRREPELRPEHRRAGATMIYTSGTTGKPKGALRRGAGDPAQAAAMLAVHRLHARRRLHHDRSALPLAGPAASWASRRRSARPIVLQRKFEPEDWLRLRRDVPGHVDVLSADADPHDLQPARPTSRPSTTASSMQRMIANAAPWSFALKQHVPRRLPGRLAVRGVRLDRARRQHDPASRRISCASRARAARPAPMRRDQAVRRRRQRGHRHRAGQPRRALRASAGVFADYYKQHDKFEDDQRDDYQTVGDIAYRDDEGLLLHLRPQEGHDHLRRHEHLPGRDRSGARAAPRRARRRRVRHPERGVGRERARRRRRAPGSELDEDDVIAHAREHLASYKVPRSVTLARRAARRPGRARSSSASCARRSGPTGRSTCDRRCDRGS